MAQEVPAWLGKALGSKQKDNLPSWLAESLDSRSEEVLLDTPLTKKGRQLGAGEDDLSDVSFKTSDKFSRGIRNNNPGNIEVGDPWQGIKTEDLSPLQAKEARFLVFKTPEMGVRAMAKIIGGTYRTKHGLTTTRGIISRWAPPEDNNDTESYIKAVSEFMGVADDERLDTTNPSVLRLLMAGMIRHENGEQPYPEATLDAGIKLALNIGE